MVIAARVAAHGLIQFARRVLTFVRTRLVKIMESAFRLRQAFVTIHVSVPHNTPARTVIHSLILVQTILVGMVDDVWPLAFLTIFVFALLDSQALTAKPLSTFAQQILA